MKKDKVLKELEAAVLKANAIKQAMIDQIKVLEEKRKNYNVKDSVVVLSVDDIDFNDDTISVINRKINLLENAVKTFKCSNYDFYKDAAREYIDLIYKEVNELDNKIDNSLDAAKKAIEEAEKAMEELKAERIPAMRAERAQLLEPLGEEVNGYWYDLKGTHVLNNLIRRIEK